MLNYEFPPIGGGSANATFHVLKEFAREGELEVDLVTSSPDGFRIQELSERIRVHRLPVEKEDLFYWRGVELLQYAGRALPYARQLLDRGRFDLCHCWSGWPPGLLGYLLRRRVPYIVSLRGSDVPGFSARLAKLDRWVFRSLSRRVWGGAAAVVANSRDLRELALRTYDGDIGVIPNGVDTDTFSPGNGCDTVLRLLYVGRFVDRKNIPLLLRALTRVTGCRLTLVGDGKRAADWRQLARSLGLEGRVRFVGRVDHDLLNEHYRAADVFVLPSETEGMSNSLLEALASGLAIVTTDTGGAAELVGGAGLMVPKRHEAAMVEALEALVRDPSRVARMKSEARGRVSGRTWRIVSDQYRDLYRDTLARVRAG